MSDLFRIGISDDFYTEAAEPLEFVCQKKLAGVPGLAWDRMQTDNDKCAGADELKNYDAIFALATKITAGSLRGVERLAVVARWGVGYDRIDVPALTEAGVALTITPGAVRRPVSEAIFTLIFALSKNLLLQDKVTRAGGWRGDLPKMGISIAGRTLGSVGCGKDELEKGLSGPVPSNPQALMTELQQQKERIDKASDGMLKRIDQFNASRGPSEQKITFSEIV